MDGIVQKRHDQCERARPAEAKFWIIDDAENAVMDVK